MKRTGYIIIGAYFLILFVVVMVGSTVGALSGSITAAGSPTPDKGYLVFVGTAVGAAVAIFLDLVMTGLLGIGALIFKPFRDYFSYVVRQNIAVPFPKLRILVYGLPRSGKTTLIRRILTDGQMQHEQSTENISIYEEPRRLNLQDPTSYFVAFADYKGQRPGQITVDPPPSFFGTPGDRVVNAVFFFADLFPEASEKGAPITDEELIARYKEDALNQLKERVNQNSGYLSVWSIQQVFTASYSEKHLFAVRLLINKIDLLKELISRDYITLPNVGTQEAKIYEFVRELYLPVENDIRKFCAEMKITDFSVHVISATKGDYIREVFATVLEEYVRRIKRS